jgi:hypothetical protein
MDQKEIKPDSKVCVLRMGIVYLSVCAVKELTRDEVEIEVNKISPTGISSQWKISDEPFSDGSPNPCQCKDDPNRLHYIMVC